MGCKQSRAFVLACLLAAACGAPASSLRRALAGSYDPGSDPYVDLDDALFDDDVVRTGIWKPARFVEIVGFGIFLTAPHDPGRTPVLLVHGHAAGPRVLEILGRFLEDRGYEPWYAFYPTGLKVAGAAALMRARLAEVAHREGVTDVLVVCHSMGGLVARAALADRDDGNDLPRVPALVTLATPWGGVERAGRWAWSPAAPDSWADMKPGSDFLDHLFDGPLPTSTRLHVLYGTLGDRASIPGPDDTVVSRASVTRAEGLAVAASVTVLDASDHIGVVRDAGPLSSVAQILDAAERGK